MNKPKMTKDTPLKKRVKSPVQLKLEAMILRDLKAKGVIK